MKSPFIHSFWPFLQHPFKSSTTQRRSRLQHRYCIGVSRRSAQATAGKGLAQGPYMVAIAGVEPTTLRLKVINSTNAPPRPSYNEENYYSNINSIVLLTRTLILLGYTRTYQNNNLLRLIKLVRIRAGPIGAEYRCQEEQLTDKRCTVLNYCIVYRYLYSASHGISQTEALSVHFSCRKKVRLKARERQGTGAERIDERRGGGRRFHTHPPTQTTN